MVREGYTVPEYRGMALDDLLADLASDAAVPGGGSATAVAASVAAAMTAKTARRSRNHLDDADRLAVEADQLAARVAPLVTVDAAMQAEALAARRRGRDAEAATAAAGPPATVTETSAAVARLAAEIAARGQADVRLDALAALRLAVAAAEEAGELAVADDSDGPRVDRVRAAVSAAREAAERCQPTA